MFIDIKFGRCIYGKMEKLIERHSPIKKVYIELVKSVVMRETLNQKETPEE